MPSPVLQPILIIEAFPPRPWELLGPQVSEAWGGWPRESQAEAPSGSMHCPPDTQGASQASFRKR